MKTQIVSFHCVMKNKLGQILGSSFNQDVINQLEAGSSSLEGLVAGLQNVRKGEKRNIAVPASQAYGVYDPDLLVEMKRTEFQQGDQLALGSKVVMQEGRKGKPKVFRVVSTKKSTIILDGNHPLAGQDLIFEIEVTSARVAKAEDFEEPNCVESNDYVH